MSKAKVIFGAGVRAEKFLVQYYNKIKIDKVFDNEKVGQFHGYPINRPYYDSNIFIIVTVDGVYSYLSIKRQLLQLGYKEFEDFVPHTIYNKKIAMAQGNCHMGAVKSFLESSKAFSEEYGFYPFPGICDLTEEFDCENVFSHVKLFIHQAIRHNNRYGERYASCIYPDVKKALGLEFEEKLIRQFSSGTSCSGYEMDFEEYVEQICSYSLIVFSGENT